MRPAAPIAPPSLATTAIAWTQVLALAGLQGAISLSWVIYRLYLPDLLAQVGAAATLASQILLFEALIGLALEPIVGHASDRLRQWLGTRFPLIALSVILAAALFLSIPLLSQTNAIGPRVLTVIIVGWAIAMTIFRSPMLVLLGNCATARSLPRAASVVMLVSMGIGAFAGVSSQFLLSLGAGITFTISSLILLLATAVLWRILPDTETPLQLDRDLLPLAPLTTPNWQLLPASGRILFTAIAVAYATRWLFAVIASLPKLFSQLHTPSLMLSVNLSAAIACIVVGFLAAWIGNNRCVVSLTAIAIPSLLGLAVAPHLPIAILCLIPLIFCLSAMNIGAIPLALSVLPENLGGLAIGLYFGALSAAFGTFDQIMGNFGDLTKLTPLQNAQWGALSLAIVAILYGLRTGDQTRADAIETP